MFEMFWSVAFYFVGATACLFLPWPADSIGICFFIVVSLVTNIVIYEIMRVETSSSSHFCSKILSALRKSDMVPFWYIGFVLFGAAPCSLLPYPMNLVGLCFFWFFGLVFDVLVHRLRKEGSA